MREDIPKLSPPGVPLLTLDDFNVPLLAKKGDEEAGDLYQAVGIAMTHWELLEIELAGLFACLIQSQSIAAHRALGAIASNVARLEVIDATGKIALKKHDPQLTDLKERIKVIRKAAARRNEITHGTVSHYSEAGGTIGCVLIPPMHNPRKFDWGGVGRKYRFNTDMVLDFAEKFRLLKAQTFDFARDLEEILPPWQKINPEPDPEQNPES